MKTNEVKLGIIVNSAKKKDGVINKIIPNKPGIYKVFFKKEDREKIVFTDAYTVNGSVLCPPRLKKGKLVQKKLGDPKELLGRFNTISSNVLYIGKADRPLNIRLKEYAQMSLGDNRHTGGIDIFNIKNYENILYVTWEVMLDDTQFDDAGDWEDYELIKFKSIFGSYPLANRKKPSKIGLKKYGYLLLSNRDFEKRE